MMIQNKFSSFVSLFLVVFLVIVGPVSAQAKFYQPGDLTLPNGYRAELVAKDLAGPTMVAFDSQDRLIIAESGAKGSGEPKVVRIESNGRETILAHGSDFGDQTPISAVAAHDGKVYIAHAGTISVLEQDGKVFRDLITDLPGNGDFPVGQMVFKGTVMYFSIGTMTNSGVVGDDNTWTSNDKYKTAHDIPCKDIKLAAASKAFSASGTSQPKDTVIKGSAKCNGAILRVNTDGSGLQVYAYGLRNPFGLEIGPDESFYVTDQGIENRGLRPFKNGVDCFYKVSEGQWFGWPDFSCGDPLKDPVTQNNPKDVQKPIAKFDSQGVVAGFAFAPSNDWGKTTDAFVALANHKVVRLDTTNGAINDFASGFDQPKDVTFSPDGSMYVTDASGAVWKISKINQANPQSTVNEKFGLSIFTSLLQLAVLGWLTWRFARKAGIGPRDYKEGARFGALAGAVSLAFMLIIATLYYRNPWFASIQLFDVFANNADVLAMQAKIFLPGLIVYFAFAALFGAAFAYILRTSKLTRVAASGALYGMVVWAILQYVILPHYSKTIIERSFPPSAFFFVFLIYGLALSYFFEKEKFQELF